MCDNNFKEEVLELLIQVQKEVASCDIGYSTLKNIEKLLIFEGKLKPELSWHWGNKNV